MNAPFTRFLTVSALLHGLILFVLSPLNGSYKLPGQNLSVQLLQPSIELPEQQRVLHASYAQTGADASYISQQSDWNRHTGQGQTTDGATRSSDAQSGDLHDRSTSAFPNSVTQQARPSVDAAGHRLQQLIVQSLIPYFHYPLLARQQGWQGEVHVAVHITRDGRLSSLHLAQSSGHPILDAAALESLKKIPRLPGAATTLGEANGFDLNVPVVYRLTEG